MGGKSERVKTNVKIIKMTVKNEIYKCNICGNTVKVIEQGVGQLVCCGEPMHAIKELRTQEM